MVIPLWSNVKEEGEAVEKRRQVYFRIEAFSKLQDSSGDVNIANLALSYCFHCLQFHHSLYYERFQSDSNSN